jgi:hypothetical protein
VEKIKDDNKLLSTLKNQFKNLKLKKIKNMFQKLKISRVLYPRRWNVFFLAYEIRDKSPK